LKSKVMEVHPIRSLPSSGILLSFIWMHKRKRSPQGVLLKKEVCSCINEKQQRLGHEYWEKALVSFCSTIWLLLRLSSILGLKPCQVTFTHSFAQADLKDRVILRLNQEWYVGPRLVICSNTQIHVTMILYTTSSCLIFTPVQFIIDRVMAVSNDTTNSLLVNKSYFTLENCP
jgi:hypothetical protein